MAEVGLGVGLGVGVELGDPYPSVWPREEMRNPVGSNPASLSALNGASVSGESIAAADALTANRPGGNEARRMLGIGLVSRVQERGSESG